MTAKQIGFVLGLASFIAILLLPPLPAFVSTATQSLADHDFPVSPDRLAASLRTVLALTCLMVIWWLTEAVPLPVTALLPIAILPLFQVIGLHGSELHEFTMATVLRNYAHPVIFLFLGGFLLAGAMRKWGVDKRLTLWFLSRGTIANDTRAILLGIMAVTALLSMWVSNTATAAMMLPLGLGILSMLNASPGSSRYGTSLMLGIGWAASIGGVGTMIGTPPNGIAIGILDTISESTPGVSTINFLEWMGFGVPYVVIFVPVAWGILLWRNPPEITVIPEGKQRILKERSILGPLSIGEKRTIAVVILAVVLWITNPFWHHILPEPVAGRLTWVDEYSIGISMGILLFLIPADVRRHVFVLDWHDTQYVDWGVLLLFGGGIALSDAMFHTGFASIIGSAVIGMAGSSSTILLLVTVVLFVDFLTEITSNTAVTSMMVPIVASIALRTGGDPVTLGIGTAVAASMAFMLPVATPPNALVYGTGFIRLRDMVRLGFFLDIIGWFLTIAVMFVFGHWIFGIFSF